MLAYEKLDVYQCSLDFVALSAQVIEALPRGHSDVANQFHRAAYSVPLNIAEGSGKMTAKDSRRYRAIARGSAAECNAILDVLDRLNVIESQQYRKGKELTKRMVQMLTKMC
ncbi:four helix bundle protein [Persicimonas caeni]|nr:four helix bundle protein [Persicimonas caeni]